MSGNKYMLPKLEAINWQSLNAAQMPQWIIGLTSTDKGDRIRAGASLLKYFREHARALGVPEEYKEVLSTDAPVLVIPFLFELLSSSEVQDKGKILHILTVLAGYRNISGLEGVHQARAKNIYQLLLEKFDMFSPFLESG